MDIKSIISEIEYYDGVFPEKKIEHLINNKEQAIPNLLKILENTYKNVTDIIEKENFLGHIYATFLLAQFREKKGYELIYNLVSMDSDVSYELFGELIIEDLHRILASLCCGDISLIKKIIENEKNDDYTRNAALKALMVLVAKKEISREEILKYFDTLYSGKLEREYSRVWTSLVKCTNDLHPREMMDKITKAYEDDLIDNFDVDIEEIEEQLGLEIDEVVRNLELDNSMTFIEDTISNMKTWECFRN